MNMKRFVAGLMALVMVFCLLPVGAAQANSGDELTGNDDPPSVLTEDNEAAGDTEGDGDTVPAGDTEGDGDTVPAGDTESGGDAVPAGDTEGDGDGAPVGDTGDASVGVEGSDEGGSTDGVGDDGESGDPESLPDTDPEDEGGQLRNEPAEMRTVSVGVISYLYQDDAFSNSYWTVHYWGGAETGDAECIATGLTVSKDVGYWDAAQAFYIFEAEIPADATGWKVHNGDRQFGNGGTASDVTAYVFEYDGEYLASYANETPGQSTSGGNSDPACQHPNAYERSGWVSVSYESVSATEHVATGVYFTEQYCPDCGTVFDHIEEQRSLQEHHAWDAQGDCVFCSAHNDCPHENIFSTVSWVNQEGCEDRGDYHVWVGTYILYTYCQDCGQYLEQSEHTGDSPESFAHNYINGVCECGHVNPCQHLNTYSSWGWIDENAEHAIIDIGDNWGHSRTGRMRFYTYCFDCNTNIEEHIEENGIWPGKEEHDYDENHTCTLCGHVNTCPHNAGTGRYVTEIEGTERYSDVYGDSSHLWSYDAIIENKCYDCGESITGKQVETVGYSAQHEWDENGVCTLCGHVNACLHPDAEMELYYMDPSQNVVEEKPGDNLFHWAVGPYYTIMRCPDCHLEYGRQEHLDRVQAEPQQHVYEERADGTVICMACGHVNTCPHELEAREIGGGWWEDATCVPIDNLNHKFTGTHRFWSTCQDCGWSWIENKQEEYTEEHDYVGHVGPSGYCHYCDYTNDLTLTPSATNIELRVGETAMLTLMVDPPFTHDYEYVDPWSAPDNLTAVSLSFPNYEDEDWSTVIITALREGQDALQIRAWDDHVVTCTVTVLPNDPQKAGDNLTWAFDEQTGTLTISGQGAMYPYNDDHYYFQLLPPWQDNIEAIRTLVLPAGITNVSLAQMGDLVNLESISITEGESLYQVVDNVLFSTNGELVIYPPKRAGTSYTVPAGTIKIGANAFQNHKLLQTVSLPEGLTEIGDRAFYECAELTAISFPSTLKKIGQFAFANSGKLSSFSLPEGLEYIGPGAFARVAGPENLVIPAGADLSWCAFEECTGIVTLRIKGDLICDPEHYFAFNRCPALTTVIFDEGVTGIPEGIFSGCENLSSVTIPESVELIYGYAFEGCKKLTELPVMSGLESIGSFAFANTGLSGQLVIPASVKTIGFSAFSGCTGIIGVTLPQGLETLGGYGNTGITSIVIPDTVTTIEEDAFFECRSLTEISIPDSVTDIKDEAFYGCSSLTSVTIPRNVENIGDRVFSKCTNLQTLTLPLSLKTFGELKSVNKLQTVNYAGTKEQKNSVILNWSGRFELRKATWVYTYAGYDVSVSENEETTTVSVETGDGAATSAALPVDAFGANVEERKPVEVQTETAQIAFDAEAADAILGNAGTNDVQLDLTVQEDENNTKILNIEMTANQVEVFANGTDGTATVTLPFALEEGCVPEVNLVVDGVRIPVTVVSYTENSVIFIVEHFSTYEVTQRAASTGNLCGENLTWSFDAGTGTLTVEGSGPMYDFSSEGATPWAQYREMIETVSLPGGLTSIGSYAFRQCRNLLSISIPNGVETIGNAAFDYCTSLKNLTIPASVTAIGSDAFTYTTSLESLTFEEGIESIGSSVFGFCGAACTVYLPSTLHTIEDWNFLSFSVAGVVYNGTISQARDIAVSSEGNEDLLRSTWHCTDGDFVPSPEEEPEDPTTGTCGENLTWTFNDYSGVLTIEGYGAMVEGYKPWDQYRSGIKEVILPDGLTTIGSYNFNFCENLTSISIPEGVTRIGEAAFEDCTGLSSVTLPDSLTVIDGCAFSMCTSLTSITIPAGVVDIGPSAFKFCSSLFEFNVAAGNEAFQAVEGVLFSGDGRELVAYPCGKAAEVYNIPVGTESIGESAFEGAQGVYSVSIPDGVTTIGVNAFYMSGLSSVTIPASVTSIGLDAFYGCSLSSIIYLGTAEQKALMEIADGNETLDREWQMPLSVPASGTCGDGLAWTFDADTWSLTVTGTGAMTDYSMEERPPWYAARDFITSVTLDAGITRIGDYAFGGLSEITSISVPGTVTSIGNSAFECCRSLTIVTLHSGLLTIGEYGFTDCSSLEQIVLPDTVTSIGEGAFMMCGLSSVTLSENLTYMGVGAFAGNFGITSVSIPDGVTVIEAWLFQDCEALSTIALPATVEAIGDRAFSNCGSLRDIAYGGTLTQKADILIVRDEFDELPFGNEPLLNAVWHCSYETYVTVEVTDTAETTTILVQGDTQTEAQATIPADVFSNEEETNKPVEIWAQAATVVFNEQAAGAIAVNAGAADIQLSIEVTPDEQQEDVITVEISVQTADEQPVFAEGNAAGSADVTVPYAVTAGNEPVVFLISGEERIPVEVIAYNAESVTFRVQHFSTYEVAQQAIPPLLLDETNFPDEYFRAWLFNTAMMFTGGAIEEQQENGVYYLTHEQVMALDDLDIFGEQITDLTGLEKLENLQNFMMYDISVASLDLSALPALKSCDFSDMENLASLKLPASVEYVSIDAALTSLDLSSCSSLSRLALYETGLSTLDVSQNTNLTYLEVVDSEAFTTLVLGSQPNLTYIQIESTGLTSLDLSGCTALTDLYCPNNHLAELSLPDTVELTSFSGDGQTVTGQGQIQNTDPRWYIFYMGNLFSEYTSLSKVSVPMPQAEISSGPDSNGAIVEEERFHSFYYDYQVTAEYSMRVTVNVTYFDEEEIDLSDVSGWQSLSLNGLGWIWNDHVLTPAQAKIVADGCDTLWLSINDHCPSAEDEAVYADNMAKVERLEIDIETEGDGALTFTFPEADQPSMRTTTIECYSLLPVTINAADSAGNIHLTVSGGTLTFNGNVDELELKQWYAPYEPFTEADESRDVLINGSVNKLKWNGETYVPDASTQFYYGRYRGALTVIGSIVEGLEYGGVSFDVEGLSDLAFNMPVKRISKTAEDDPLVIQKGGFLQITDYVDISPSVDDVLFRYRYADHLGDDTSHFRWSISLKMSVDDPDLEVMLPLTFTAENIHFGTKTTVLVEGPGTSDEHDPDAFGEECIVLNGDLARLEVWAAPVLMNGDVTYARIYDLGNSFAGSSDVVLNGIVGELQLDGCHLKTSVRTGENGSVQGGSLRKSQYKLVNSSTASVYTLYERYFESVEENTDVMRNGALKIMSKSWEEQWASVVADSDAIAEAANLASNQYAIMTIKTSSGDLSEDENILIENALVENGLEGAEVVSAFDVDITTYTMNGDGAVTDSIETTELNESVTFALQTPDDPTAAYQVVRIHDGVAEVMENTVFDNGQAEVTSNLFSKYVIAKTGATGELDFENQDRYHEFRYGFDGYIGWQVLDYWTNEYLSVSVQDAEQLLADGKWFDLFFYASPGEDELFYADALDQVSLLEIYGGGTYAFDFQQKDPIDWTEIFINHPDAGVTISGTTSHPGEDTYINAVIFNGNVTINGDLDSLTLAGKADVPNEDAVVHVNGSIEELIWYDESAKAFSNGNRDPYKGDLYVTGNIVSGLEKGQRAIDISQYIQNYTVDYDIGTFTKTGTDPESVLVIEKGVLRLTLVENPLDVSTMHIVYRLEEDAQTWTLLAAPANAGYLRIMGALEDFDISKVVPGDHVGVIIKGAPEEPIELNGRYYAIDLYAGTVIVNGEDGYTLPGLCVAALAGQSASVTINCAIDELEIESTNRQTQIQTGPSGNVNHGSWRFYLPDWEYRVQKRLFDTIGPNQQVMANGALLLMSVDEYGEHGAILTGMDALEDAVDCSSAHVSVMDIWNGNTYLNDYVQHQVWNVAPAANIISQYDVRVLTYALDESGAVQSETEEYQLSEDVVFYLQTPVDVADATYKVVRLFHGETTLLVDEADGDDGMIRVQTNILGTFVVVNTNVAVELDFEHPEERYHGFWYGRNGYNGWQVLDEQADVYLPVSLEDAERLLINNNWFYLTFETVPTGEYSFYSDHMGKLSSVYFNCPGEMSFDASAAYESLNSIAVNHPDARITLTRAPGAHSYFYVEVYSGSLTVNGDVHSLLLTGTEAARDDAVVRINGSVTELTWYGKTSQMDDNGNAAPYTGDLYVTGAIGSGIESGKRVIHIDEYVGDIEANLAIRRFSKTADDGELVIEDGELVSTLLQTAESVGEITREDLILNYRRGYGDEEDWYLDVSVNPDLNLGSYASSIHLQDFNASKIQSGDSVFVNIGDSPSDGTPIVLSGHYAEVDVDAGVVQLTGSTPALYVWGFGIFSHAVHPQTEVVIDGQVDFLSIQGVHRGTDVRTGANGSVNSGMWMFYFNGGGDGAPSRWWDDPIGANQPIMTQGSLQIMSVDGNGEYGSIVTGMDDLTAAAGITDNNSFAAMEIRNAEVSLDEAEQELVSNVVPGGTILTEFDVQVTAYTVDEDGNMTDMNSVSALETAAAFALQTPTNDPDATYQVVRLHEEDGETVATPVGDPAAATAGRVEVTSSLFSKYVVVKVGGSPFTGSWTPVDPDEFDPAFLAWLLAHDYVREVDGEFAFDLDADRMEIDADLSSIRGVNKFINLEVLAYEGHENWENGQAYRLTEVDLSGMTKLQELYLNDNALTSGALVASNWSTDTILKLELRSNGLDSIAFLNNFTALEELNVSGNNFTAMDVSSISTLQYLDCQFNGDLAALTVNPGLEGLCMGGTKLSLHDIEFNGAALKILKIDYMSEDQNITATDLINQQNLDGLETLDLDNHDWGTFDFSHWQSTLKDIRIDGCGLTGLTLGTNLPNMTRVRANGNRLTSLDLIGMNPQVFTELYLFENSIPALTLPAGTKLEGECGDGLMDEGRHPLQQIIHDATVTDNGDGTWRFDLHALSNDLNPAKVSIDVQGLVTEYDSTTGIVTFSAEPKNFTYEYDIGDCGRFAYKMPVLVCFYTAGEGVAQVGDTVYDTFAAAAAAANNGEQVITLLANIVEPYTLGVDVHTVKVDRDGYYISIPMDAPCWGSVQLTYEEDVEVYHLEYAVADPDEDWAGRYRHLYYYEGGWFIDDHENGDRLTLVTADFLRDHITSNINAHLMAAPAANDPMWDVILSNLGDSATGTMMMLDGLDFSCSGKVTLVIPEGVNCGMTFAVNNPEADITIIRYDTSNPAIDVNAGKLTYTGDIGELRLWTREGQGDVNSSVTVNGNIQEIDFRGNGANEESIKAFLGRVYVNGTIGKIRERGIQILDLTEYNMGIHEVNMAVRLVEQYVTHGTELIIENVDEDDIGIVIPTQTVTIQNENLTFDFHLTAGSDHDIATASCSAFDSVTGSYCSFDLENFTMSDLGNIPVEQMNAVVIGRGEGYTLDLIGTYHNVQVQNNANLNVPEGTVLSWLLIDNAEPDKRHDEDQVPNQMITIGGQVDGLDLKGHMNHTTVVIGSTGSVSMGTWRTFNYGDYYNMKARYFRASGGVIMENGALKVLSYDVQNFDSALGAIMPSSATLDAATEVAENQSVYMDISSSNVENLTDDERAALGLTDGEDGAIAAVFSVDVAKLTFKDGRVESGEVVTQLNNEVPFVLELPEDADSNIYEVIRLHEEGGGIEATTVTTSAIGEDTVTVSSNKFSVYLLRRIVPVASFVVDEGTGIASATIDNSAFQTGENVEKVLIAPAENSVITVTFDETAVAAIADRVEALDDTVGIILSVEKIAEESAGTGDVVSVTFEITMVTTTGEEVFSDSNAEGTAIVTVPFPAGDGKVPLVYLVTDDVQTPIQVIGHTAETVTFVTRHFSVYKVVSVDDTPVTVTFDLNGGRIGDSTENITVNVTPGQMIGDQKPADPTKIEGTFFGGWCTSEDGGATLNPTAFDFSTPIEEDLTLYARWIEEPNVKIAATLDLSDYIRIRPRIKNLTHADHLEYYHVEASFNGETTVKGLISELLASGKMTDSEGRYVCVAADVAAPEMSDILHLVLSYVEDPTYPVVICTFDYSVRQYCEEVIESDDPRAEDLKPVCQTLLNYGAYAQRMFNHNTNDLANSNYNAGESGIAGTSIPANYAHTCEGSCTGIRTSVDITLNLQSATEMRIKFRTASDDISLSDYSFKVNDVLAQATVEGNRFVIIIPGIAGPELGKEKEIVIENKEDESIMTVRCSPISYVYLASDVLPSDNITALTMKALYCYYKEASEYFKTN